MKISVYDPKKRKKVTVGIYNIPKRTLTKKVSKEHYMILERSYGISEEVVNQLKDLNCKWIQIITSSAVYSVSFYTFLTYSRIKDYGHGQQRFLPVIHMARMPHEIEKI